MAAKPEGVAERPETYTLLVYTQFSEGIFMYLIPDYEITTPAQEAVS